MSEESIIDRADHRTLLSIGKFLLNKQKLKQAEAIYNKCIFQYPDDFRAYFNLGNVFKSNKNNNAALDYYIKSLDKINVSTSIIIDKDDALSVIYGAISTIYIKLGDPIKSIDYCNRVSVFHSSYNNLF
jgi:tetratricopeptide (TPR) repeat protein